MAQTELPAHPANVPWHDDCLACFDMSADPQPGLATWLLAVAAHFDSHHDEILVGK